MTQSSPSAAPYRRDAVPLGPFDVEPFDLKEPASRLPDGSWREGDDLGVFLAEWLVGALTTAGVALGDYDHVAVGLIAEDGWTTVQVVAGWVARAGQDPDHPDAASRPGR